MSRAIRAPRASRSSRRRATRPARARARATRASARRGGAPARRARASAAASGAPSRAASSRPISQTSARRCHTRTVSHPCASGRASLGDPIC